MYIYTDELRQTLIDCTHTSLSDIVQLCDTNQLETLATVQWNKGDRELHNLNLTYRLWRHHAEKAPAKGGCPYQTRPDAHMKILWLPKACWNQKLLDWKICILYAAFFDNDYKIF